MMDIFYSDGLNKFLNDMNKASIDAWDLALRVLLDYQNNKKWFKECYGLDTPEEVLAYPYADIYEKREAYVKKLKNNLKLSKKVSDLLDEYDREDILKALKEVSEG